MIEDGALDLGREFEDPVRAMHEVSHDLTLRQPLQLHGGTTITALEIQFDLLEQAEKYTAQRGFDNVGGDAVGRQVLGAWGEVLDRSRNRPGLGRPHGRLGRQEATPRRLP